MLCSHGWDVFFAAVEDDGREVFYGRVKIRKVVYVEFCEGGILVAGEGDPINSVVVDEGLFPRGVKLSV